FCHYPLILMSHGQERIARSLLPEYQGVLRSEVTTVTRGSFPALFLADRLLRRVLNSILSIIGKEPARSTLAFLKRARRGIEAIRLPSYKMRDRRRLLESMISPSYEAEGPSLPLTLRKILT